VTENGGKAVPNPDMDKLIEVDPSRPRLLALIQLRPYRTLTPAQWAAQSGEASNYTDNLPGQCLHPVGHWYEVPNLLRNGTLPEVWIPPGELRDQRELLRLRIFLVRMRTRVKNRIHATLRRHNIQVPGADLFGVAARKQLGTRLPELPVHCREAVEQELATVDFLKTQIESA
jgi:hypothetical protein